MGIAIFLFIVIVAQGTFLFLFKKELRSIKMQLKERINGSEKPINVSFIDHDISELASEINHVMSYGKKQSIQLYQKEQHLKTAIANISHDLRTPLTAIIGYLQLLQKTVLEPEQQAYVETVLLRAEDMKKLIGDFYDISVWETKERIPDLKKINLDHMLTDTVLAYTEQFDRKKMTPCITCLNDTAFVMADEIMLKRVFDNLIVNAIDYGSDELKISIIKNKNYLSVRFQNNVQDKEKIQIDKIFDEFYTADVSRNNSGTGLGLVIVRLLMEKMGGTVRAVWDGDDLCIIISF